jgi:hypothetical protein
MPTPFIGAVAGSAASIGGIVGGTYLLPAKNKKMAALVGAGATALTAGTMWFVDSWRDGAFAAAATGFLISGARAAEAYLLPKPAGGRDLGVLTMEELRAVVASERRGGGLSGAPAGLLGAGRFGATAGRVSPNLSAAFGSLPLVDARG